VREGCTFRAWEVYVCEVLLNKPYNAILALKQPIKRFPSFQVSKFQFSRFVCFHLFQGGVVTWFPRVLLRPMCVSEIPEAGVLSGVVRRSGEHQCCGSACYPPPAGFRLADSGRDVHTPSGGPPSYVTGREGEGPHRTAQVPDA